VCVCVCVCVRVDGGSGGCGTLGATCGSDSAGMCGACRACGADTVFPLVISCHSSGDGHSVSDVNLSACRSVLMTRRQFVIDLSLTRH